VNQLLLTLPELMNKNHTSTLITNSFLSYSDLCLPTHCT